MGLLLADLGRIERYVEYIFTDPEAGERWERDARRAAKDNRPLPHPDSYRAVSTIRPSSQPEDSTFGAVAWAWFNETYVEDLSSSAEGYVSRETILRMYLVPYFDAASPTVAGIDRQLVRSFLLEIAGMGVAQRGSTITPARTFTVDEAAAHFGVSTSKIKRMILHGRLPNTTPGLPGRARRIPAGDLIAAGLLPGGSQPTGQVPTGVSLKYGLFVEPIGSSSLLAMADQIAAHRNALAAIRRRWAEQGDILRVRLADAIDELVVDPAAAALRHAATVIS